MRKPWARGRLSGMAGSPGVDVRQLVADQRQTMGVAGLEPVLPEEDLAARAEGIRPEATVQLIGRRVVVEPGLSGIQAQ